jgi:glyoxylate reductase
MRVLIAAALAPFLDATAVPAGLDVALAPDGEPVPGGEFVGVLPHVALRIGADDLDRLPRLKVIANYGVGYDNVDVAAAARRGVLVSNTPGVLTSATAELTWALILAAARRVGEGERLVRSGGWSGWQPTQLLGMELRGKVLGVVGAGRIGMEVGRRAGVFGMSVIYWNRSARPDWQREIGASRRGLPQLLAEADVVTIHLPMARETRGLIGAEALAVMKPTAILVNTARGALVDEAALAAALGAGRLRAAALDVYDAEPRVPGPLLELENVVLLPHLGSATEDARRGMWELAWANLLRGVAGEPLLTPVA